MGRAVSPRGDPRGERLIPDKGLQDGPQDFDEVGGVHDIQGLQVLLVPEEGDGGGLRARTRRRPGLEKELQCGGLDGESQNLPVLFFSFLYFIYLLIWLPWVFVAACRLSCSTACGILVP